MDRLCPGERRADGVEAELTVDVLAYRVVDPGNHPGNLEDLASDLGRHDVSIVAVGQGGEAIGGLDAGLAQDILIDPVAENHLPGEIAPPPVERAAIHINDGPPATPPRQGDGRHCPNAAAADNHQLH